MFDNPARNILIMLLMLFAVSCKSSPEQSSNSVRFTVPDGMAEPDRIYVYSSAFKDISTTDMSVQLPKGTKAAMDVYGFYRNNFVYEWTGPAENGDEVTLNPVYSIDLRMGLSESRGAFGCTVRRIPKAEYSWTLNGEALDEDGYTVSIPKDSDILGVGMNILIVKATVGDTSVSATTYINNQGEGK